MRDNYSMISLLQGPADMKYLLALTLVYSVLAQDTYHCPDGWVLEEDRSGCRCFMFSGEEMVTRMTLMFSVRLTMPGWLNWTTLASTTGSSPSC